MLKRSVQTIFAVMLMAGTAVAVAAPPASALNYFVHGNIQCQVHGNTRYTPPLKRDVGQTVRSIIKGTLDNCTDGRGNAGGETGLGTTRVLSGKFKVLSNPFSGTCDHISDELTDVLMQIKWNSNNGTKIRDTNVGWTGPQSATTEPYGLTYAGGTIDTMGLNGSYLGGTAAVSFLSDGWSSSASCGSRLKTPWPFGADGSSMLTFMSPPTVNDITPNGATLGTSNLDVTITGMDFTPDDVVSFSGDDITVNSTTYVSATELSANISVASNALADMRDVIVTNSSLGAGTCQDCFMVSPIVTSVAPGTVAQGAANKTIAVTGDGFTLGAYAEVLGTGVYVNYTNYVSPTQLNVNVALTTGAPLGARDVKVTDPGGGFATCIGCLTVTAGPTVTSTTPSSRGGGSINQVVAVNGSNFGPGATVSFGGAGITVNSSTYVSPTKVNANISIADGAAIGGRSVSVLNTDGGLGSCVSCFTVNKTPHIDDFQVLSGPIYGWKLRHHHHGYGSQKVGTFTVQIIGTNFVNGATVSYASDTVDINSTTFVSSTKIKMNISIDVVDFYDNELPPGRTVTITNPDGGSYACGGCLVLIV